MYKKGKGSMDDEDTSQQGARQLQQKPKIIIRKCKKTPTVLVAKSSDDSKKINGELSAGKKSKQSNDVGGEGIKTDELDSELCDKVMERKQPETVEVNLEDESILNEDINSKKSDRKDNSSPVEFKGFKKRILAQTEKLKDGVADSADQCPCEGATEAIPESDRILRPRIQRTYRAKKKIPANSKKGTEVDSDENQAESQAEYAQYLGLQPTMQFKCYRCGEKGFPSMFALNLHQRGCGVSQKTNFIANLQQDTVPPSDPNMLTNFRITRKVYLCSACGTYYENWNLFLHMRDVHKKHICLFCLTMFGVAEKLADHLKTTHSVQENTYKSSEDFQSAYKGSCYLICCSCENMFNERENYFHHQCVKRDPSAKCNLCGVRCGHYYTCPNSSSSRPLAMSSNHQVTASTSKPAINKFFGLGGKKKEKAAEELWMGKKAEVHGSGDTEEDYDISHAASFCHVDIGDELGEKDKSGTEDNPVEIDDDDNNTGPITNEKNTSEESKSIESTEQSNDESVSTKADTQTVENEHCWTSKSNPTVEAEAVTLKERVEGKSIVVELSKIEENEKQMEDDSTDELDQESSIKTIRDENLIEKDSNSQLHENENENDVEDTVSKEASTNIAYSEQKSPEEAVISDQTETDEVSKTVGGESQPSPQKIKHDSTSSDSDEEPGTHLSVSQEDSRSSSDESSDGEPKKGGNKKLVESNKDESVGESEDSSKSDTFSSETLNSRNLESNQENKTKPNDKPLGHEENLQETQSSLTNDASKDPHLNEVCVLDDKTEDGSKVQENQPESILEEVNDGIPLASKDVPAMALTLEDKLDDASSQSVVKECVRTSCLNCVYCSHAIKIAVNGKQLALHLLAEHRYKPVKNNETSQDVVKKLKNSLADLESVFFNTDSYDSSDKSLNTLYDYTYECFQCRFVTKVHKELYVHKRKMHQKTVLLCVMCKSNFYSYSELLCHMCPGIYVSEDINFRCCFCNLDMIPSAFRLMVHLRKSHHTCDICLEVAGDQQKLSTHMWKHKLNHLCYRCGIAYRNKPDITKHLFWKHGTESVLCKKCLQKKWPHVYHFCIPPTVFICEECNASFTRAVALKVHKRFHGGELPYGCTKCEQKFVSKKLLAKHEDSHNKPSTTETPLLTYIEADKKQSESADENINVESIDEPVQESVKDLHTKEILKDIDSKQDVASESKSKKKKKKEKDRKEKPVLDVYDLPPLNLSSESDSSDEEANPITSETAKEKQSGAVSKISGIQPETNKNLETADLENSESSEEPQAPAPIVDGVWDNFHFYKAELEKRESKDLSLPNILPSTSSGELKTEPLPEKEPKSSTSLVLLDHSYCLIPGKLKPSGNEEETSVISDAAPIEEATAEVSGTRPAPRGHSSSIDHAYATLTTSVGEVATEQILAPTPTTPLLCSAPQVETHSSNKKKQKTPKKKKHNTNSSSSSESSSDSDSSSCTCQSNCSCSGSSSNSSSSSSSDSESSTSEGKRRIAAKREKKKERLREKHLKEESAPKVDLDVPPLLRPQEDESVIDVPLEPIESPIRESDLDTDESSTDEDFYDKYPQSHAKQQMEKRNKLMLLASVAPVNNGTVSPPPPPPEEKPIPPPPTTKRKIKTKKRRKSQQTRKSSNKSTSVPNQTQPSASVSSPIATSTPSSVSINHHSLTAKASSPLRIPHVNFQADVTAGSGSENESARLSKRKRVRNKFYGYSSEEEDEERQERPPAKWRKVDPAPTSQGLSFQPSLSLQRPQTTIKRPKPSDSSGTEDEPPMKKEEFSNSSCSTSESENELDTKGNLQNQTEKSDNLYCYCQCPYDEVSEMIACDGQDCTIEWFHFECVGIMVPPKGKWYCPDCRKRRDLM